MLAQDNPDKHERFIWKNRVVRGRANWPHNFLKMRSELMKTYFNASKLLEMAE